MIRNLMIAAGLFTLTAGSAMAATTTHAVRSHHKVAQAGETAPATGDAAKTEKPAKAKKSKGKKAKAEGAKAEGDKAEGTKTEAPAPTPAPTPAPKK